MSQYGKEFRLQWITAVNGFTVRSSFFDTENLIGDSDTPEVISLEPTGHPLIFSTIDNEGDKFKPIRAKQAKTSFLSRDFDITTFFDGADNKWLNVVTLPDSGVELFRGFLVLSDISQPFLPDPVQVTLTATDKLGTLKDVPYTNNNTGEVETGKVLISIWLAECLRHTGLNLDILVKYNIREVDSHNDHLFWKNYLDALTFEDKPGTAENCYLIVEKILGKTGFGTQYKGKWVIQRIDEFDFQYPDYIAVFDYQGNFVSISNSVTHTFNIGALSAAIWREADQILGTERPHNFIVLTLRYELPFDLPCNVDFERGDFISDIDADSKKYDLDCWTLYEGRPLVASTHSTAFIQRNFNTYDTEIERFAVIDVATALNEQILRSEKIEVRQKDKFDFSFGVKYNGQVETAAGTITTSFAQMHLHAHDGTFYTLDPGFDADLSIPEWVECTSSFSTFQKFFKFQYDGTDDDTQWRLRGVENGEYPIIPKDGYLYIVFCHQLKVTQFQLHIGSVRFELFPYVNGSYQKFTGQEHKINRSETGFIPSKDEIVYIGDTPHPVYKGTIFKFDNGLNRFIPGTQYYDHQESPSTIPPTISGKLLPFSHLQAIDFWNQYKLGFRKIEGSILGLDDDNPPDVVHRYIFTNTDPNINGRTFMCTGFEQDWKTEEWRGTFVEVYRNSIGRTYTDNHIFKYLTNG